MSKSEDSKDYLSKMQSHESYRITAIGKKAAPKYAKSREKIVEILKVHPEYSGTKLAKELGISPKAVEKHLAKFKAEGRLAHEGPDKGGRWIVKG